MATRGLAVEFLGMPGSGKSTLSRRAAGLLVERGLAVTQPSYPLAHDIPLAMRRALKARQVAAELMAHPSRSARAVQAIRDSRQDRAVDVCKMAFNWLLVTHLMRNPPAAGDLHMYDQGVLQALWSIGYGGGAGAIASTASLLEADVPRADVVVVVAVTATTLARRLAGRVDRDSRLDRPGPGGAIARGLGLLQEVRQVLGSWSRRHGSPRILEIPNDEDDRLDGTAATLAEELRLLLTGR